MHWRKTLRHKTHDYTRSGYYFFTFITRQRRHLLSHIHDDGITLTPLGERCKQLLDALPSCFEALRVDMFIVMPDHVHLLVEVSPQSEVSVSDLLRWLKSLTTKHYIASGGAGSLWQRGSYDVIVPDDEALARVRDYIRQNPARG